MPAALTRVRTTWRVGGSVLAALALLSFAWEAVDQLASRPETRTERLDAAGLTLVIVEVDRGDVTVSGRVDTTVVEASARLRFGLVDPDYTVERDGTTLRVRARCSPISDNCLERIELTVPPELDVRVSTEDGDVRIGRLAATLTVTTENGDVVAERLSGASTLRSDNGDVTARRVRSRTLELASDNGSLVADLDAAPTRISADSDNGDVTVRLPAEADVDGIDFAVTATSDNGAVTTPIRTNPTSDRSIQATSDNGDVSVTYRR